MQPQTPFSDYVVGVTELSATEYIDNDEIQLDESEPAHVITMIHGIRDLGMWALNLQYHAQRNGLGVVIAPVTYGRLGSFLFLSRIGARKRENAVLAQVRDIFARHPTAVHSLVAHSNGTKIALRILPHLHPYVYKNIILCGSVCKTSECPIVSIPTKVIVNDCSPVDFWPIVAEIINPCQYEATGTYGFRNASVRDRFFTVKHGGCLTQSHFERFVLPIILRNALKFGEPPRWVFPVCLPAYVRRVLLLLIAGGVILFLARSLPWL